MDNKATMLEAVKRKRYQIQQHEEDQTGPDNEGEGARMGDDELAPASGSHNRDALLGKPETEPEPTDEKSETHQNETELGQEGGFNKVIKAGAPANSKNLFHDPKKDTHDPVDLNKHRNMANTGLNEKYDKMGVNEHKDVRLQSSNLAKRNAIKDEGIKKQSRSAVKSSMDMPDIEPTNSEDVQDAVHDNEQQGPGFDSDDSNGADSDNDTAPPGSGGAMKKARGRLEGFLSKMKNS